ncbi:MAG: hypothetical protein JRG91_00895 [Deltaproteobacteria bacterium]|nr:hypothetical protein [Deltaproteobacteria bacterium]
MRRAKARHIPRQLALLASLFFGVLLLLGAARAAAQEEGVEGEAPAGSETTAEEEAPAEEKEPHDVAIGALAYGQYVLTTGDRRKLLEDEGNRMRHGFLLDHLLLKSAFENGLVLDFGFGVFVPDAPEHTDGWLLARLRKPGKWSLKASASRLASYSDDSIGSTASAAGYPSLGLGWDVAKERLDVGLAFSIKPAEGLKLGLSVDYSNILGREVPLKGSALDRPGGPVFEYPAIWHDSDHRGAVMLDAAYHKGGFGISLLAGYRFTSIDATLKAWRPPAFDDTDGYERARVIHHAFARLGTTIAAADFLTIQGGYHFSFSHTQPGTSQDSVQSVFGTQRRIEYAKGPGISLQSHTIPLGFLLRPAAGLGVRLHLKGSYAFGEGRRTAAGYLGDTSTLVSDVTLRSGIEAKEFSEGLEASFSKLSWLDLKVRQRFEIEHKDLFKVLFDDLEDGWDETRAEDTALLTIRNRVEAILRFRPVKGLIIEAVASYRHVKQDEMVEDLIDWISYGDAVSWNVDARLAVKYRLGPKLRLWISGRFFHGLRWRPEVTDAGTGYVYDTTGWVASGGVRSMPLAWLSLHAAYSYTHGDYEVGRAALLGAWGPILYQGRIHTVIAGFSLNPLDWLALDASYNLALVDGTAQSVLHRINAEARFRLWKSLHLGVGYMGRIHDDEQFGNDAYGGHAVRALFSGAF